MTSSTVQIFVRVDDKCMALDLDLDSATPATVQSIVDAHCEAEWRATGVRVLRSDLPFIGPKLKTASKPNLDFEKTLAENGLRKGSTLEAWWPCCSAKAQRRKRYGRSWGDECCNKTHGRVAQQSEDGKKRSGVAKKQAQRRAEDRIVTESLAGDEAQSEGREGKEVDVQAINVNREEMREGVIEEEDGGEQGEGYPAADILEVPDEQGHRELISSDAEEVTVSGTQLNEDPFATNDQNKENWDPQFLAALLGRRS